LTEQRPTMMLPGRRKRGERAGGGVAAAGANVERGDWVAVPKALRARRINRCGR
jgi:hypothetical protein